MTTMKKEHVVSRLIVTERNNPECSRLVVFASWKETRMSENIGRHWMGGARRTLHKRKRNPVEMQKVFFAKQAQRQRMADWRRKSSPRPQTLDEEFLSLSKPTEEKPEKESHQTSVKKMSLDELALMTPQQAATINDEVGQVLSIWLES